ncbi:lysophospholipid acyltransferase family protein [Dokdonella immobilis]|uniref:1-acyl-sn-glycerol-3-phosphate acyltransferase n=1 Tax=Dokdonella immobilis TaxID=578942 RepID=A0A1I4X158_9GAMM|nr:lysophospholipid acyltransferase family protein [Dokdonella immobilis]SFN19741.1 1-acyl-sn-glycerol-3-phosphate acyltransferase [Dokdonella immobilis]
MAVTSSSVRPGISGAFGWRVLNALQLLFTVLWTGALLGPALLLLVLCGGRRRWPLRMASRIWAPGLLAGAGVRLDLEGFDAIDFSKPHIVVANHQSMIDVCVLYRALPVPLRFVLKQELAHVPLIGWYARAMGMVFIEREAARKAARRLHAAHDLFAAGDSLCAFPEGTRSRDGRVGAFKGGVFKLAIESGVPILPVAIEGSGRVLPASGFSVRPGCIRLRAGDPISTDGLQVSDRNLLARRCHDAVIALLDQALPGSAPAGH